MDRYPSFKLVVLSMPDATARRARISDALSADKSLEWDFFDALTTGEIQSEYDDETAYNANGSVMSTAEISCASSHIQIMREFVRSPAYDYLIVLEDDLFIDPNFSFSRIVQTTNILRLDYLKLYARYYVPARYIGGVGRSSFYRTRWPTLGTQAYVLSRPGAQIMLQTINKKRKIVRPIDVSMDRFWETGLPIVMIYPFPLLELAMPSGIHTEQNWSQMNEKNLALSEKWGARPHKFDKFKETISRMLNDKAMRKTDSELTQRIRDNYQMLHNILVL